MWVCGLLILIVLEKGCRRNVALLVKEQSNSLGRGRVCIFWSLMGIWVQVVFYFKSAQALLIQKWNSLTSMHLIGISEQAAIVNRSERYNRLHFTPGKLLSWLPHFSFIVCYVLLSSVSITRMLYSKTKTSLISIYVLLVACHVFVHSVCAFREYKYYPHHVSAFGDQPVTYLLRLSSGPHYRHIEVTLGINVKNSKALVHEGRSLCFSFKRETDGPPQKIRHQWPLLTTP